MPLLKGLLLWCSLLYHLNIVQWHAEMTSSFIVANVFSTVGVPLGRWSIGHSQLMKVKLVFIFFELSHNGGPLWRTQPDEYQFCCRLHSHLATPWHLCAPNRAKHWQTLEGINVFAKYCHPFSVIASQREKTSRVHLVTRSLFFLVLQLNFARLFPC